MLSPIPVPLCPSQSISARLQRRSGEYAWLPPSRATSPRPVKARTVVSRGSRIKGKAEARTELLDAAQICQTSSGFPFSQIQCHLSYYSVYVFLICVP
ncbi:hypothetical protein E2C01_044056 [Portunus trituberculatus]|uniref:Uncharacterized protein n=1 Tax=Portunus trituberculatus TaxID=210409 RepID=A0A5B7FUJ7_PORTR|nr:hypothetical protein [Portunus trituberculatus]